MPEDPSNWPPSAVASGANASDEDQGTHLSLDSSADHPVPAVVQAAAKPSIWSRLADSWRGFLNDQVTPVRLASHVALVLVAVLVVALSRVELPQWTVAPPPLPPAESPTQEAPPVVWNREPVGGSPLLESSALVRAPVPFTESAQRPRTEVITYTVQMEDTILGIAEKFGLNPNTIVWANHDLSENPFLLEIGQELIILPVDGVYHKVKKGDTVEKLAKRYRVTPEKIVNFPLNNLQSKDDPLVPDTMLIIPDGDATPPEPPAVRAPSAPWRSRNMVWPARGRLTQGFWLPAHPAIDIGAHTGAPVWAADEGVVAEAGWSNYGYGYYVLIRHYDGFSTLYAHLSRIDVSPGEAVGRGQQIGAIGSTGRSTGPHLHLEVRYNGRAYNPLVYLP